jgi:hypothetical protein
MGQERKRGQCKPRKKKGGYRCKCKRGFSGKYCDIGKYSWYYLIRIIFILEDYVE